MSRTFAHRYRDVREVELSADRTVVEIEYDDDDRERISQVEPSGIDKVFVNGHMMSLFRDREFVMTGAKYVNIHGYESGRVTLHISQEGCRPRTP